MNFYQAYFNALIEHTPILSDLRGGANSRFPNIDDAVIVKAGNNVRINTDASIVEKSRYAEIYQYNTALVLDDEFKTRLLFVGALDRYAHEGGAQAAWYSAYPGFYPDYQQRFLLEYGGSPFDEEHVYFCARSDSVNCIGPDKYSIENTDNVQGTLYAAGRVSGYAALLRGKFPNLTGVQTAQLLLDTATYEGLACNSKAAGCAPSIYGQGRVDITAALSPTGQLQ